MFRIFFNVFAPQTFSLHFLNRYFTFLQISRVFTFSVERTHIYCKRTRLRVFTIQRKPPVKFERANRNRKTSIFDHKLRIKSVQRWNNKFCSIKSYKSNTDEIELVLREMFYYFFVKIHEAIIYTEIVKRKNCVDCAILRKVIEAENRTW